MPLGAAVLGAAPAFQPEPLPGPVVPIITPTIAAPEAAVPDTKEKPIVLDALQVATTGEDENFDFTGQGTMEMELNEAPFSNDLLGGMAVQDDASGAINAEMGQIAGVAPADLTLGPSRVDVRGFPTPRLRNGFTQAGVPETLHIESSQQIVGPITSVTGRSAPGGINNYVTGRPRARAGTILSSSASTLKYWRVAADTNQVLKAGKAWHRWVTAWTQKHGPENFAYTRMQTVDGSATWRLSAAHSLMLQVNYTNYRGNPSSGVPEYRPTRTAKIVGPYRPLAYFHHNGPTAVQAKRVGSVAAQYEGQLTRYVAMRATAQKFYRQYSDNRYTRGEYLLDEQVFNTLREPFHIEMPLEATTGGAEVTGRFAAGRTEHKVMAAIETSHISLDRRQRQLDLTERWTLLPVSFQRYSPASPSDFFLPYSPDVFKRVVTDRTDETRYTSLLLTERMALDQGRFVGTTGIRQDAARLDIFDRRPGVVMKELHDAARKHSWHLGGNYIVKPSKMLVFANTSTAYEPTLRVDSRTGKIQGNETTFGYEAGATGLAFYKTVAYTVTAFTYFNQNIARRNPLYYNPVYDANHTQPELVAAGEERFRGALVDLRWRPVNELTLTGRYTYTQATTTASPDLPEEVGRQLARLPVETATASARYGFITGRFAGLWAAVSWVYIGPFVGFYENAYRQYLHYPGYQQTTLSFGHRLIWGKVVHSASVGIRNVFNQNLLGPLARPASGRELTLSLTSSW